MNQVTQPLPIERFPFFKRLARDAVMILAIAAVGVGAVGYLDKVAADNNAVVQAEETTSAQELKAKDMARFNENLASLKNATKNQEKVTVGNAIAITPVGEKILLGDVAVAYHIDPSSVGLNSPYEDRLTLGGHNMNRSTKLDSDGRRMGFFKSRISLISNQVIRELTDRQGYTNLEANFSAMNVIAKEEIQKKLNSEGYSFVKIGQVEWKSACAIVDGAQAACVTQANAVVPKNPAESLKNLRSSGAAGRAAQEAESKAIRPCVTIAPNCG
jgi:hypothetical protein